jgi:hypothetical protein
MPSFTFISQKLDERWVFGFCQSGGSNPQKTQNVRVDKNKFFLQIRVPLFDMVIGRHQNGTYKHHIYIMAMESLPRPWCGTPTLSAQSLASDWRPRSGTFSRLLRTFGWQAVNHQPTGHSQRGPDDVY